MDVLYPGSNWFLWCTGIRLEYSTTLGLALSIDFLEDIGTNVDSPLVVFDLPRGALFQYLVLVRL